VLIEVNCETDFVARGDIFRGLCSDLAMQIAAFGDVVAVSSSDIDASLLNKEREIEMGKEDILSKPEDKRCCPSPSLTPPPLRLQNGECLSWSSSMIA
jgi:elongation factor Ts